MLDQPTVEKFFPAAIRIKRDKFAFEVRVVKRGVGVFPVDEPKECEESLGAESVVVVSPGMSSVRALMRRVDIA